MLEINLFFQNGTIPDISNLKRDEVVPIYSNALIYIDDDLFFKELNQKIMDKWSINALTYIKEKAWKYVEELKRYIAA